MWRIESEQDFDVSSDMMYLNGLLELNCAARRLMLIELTSHGLESLSK